MHASYLPVVCWQACPAKLGGQLYFQQRAGDVRMTLELSLGSTHLSCSAVQRSAERYGRLSRLAQSIQELMASYCDTGAGARSRFVEINNALSALPAASRCFMVPKWLTLDML
jgi:hypothetical protein